MISIARCAQEQAILTPHRRIFTFVDDHGNETATLTCKEIFEEGIKISNHLLQNRGIKKGDRVLLVYPPGLEFAKAFLGCILAEIIPVPVPPPQPIRPGAGLEGYVATANDCGAVAQLTSREYRKGRSFGRILEALQIGNQWPNLPWIETDALTDPSGFSLLDIPLSHPAPQTIAFLQYTSGSTRAPRGVCISHENISAQMELLNHQLGMNSEGLSVFWMPHYHDFALIGGIIQALTGGNALVLFSPISFLKRPGLWGELLTRYRATHTGAPDFGYRLLTSKTTDEQRSAWDLSTLQIAMCAAEPIRSQTVDELLAALSSSRFNPAAFSPSYGLAEHTIAVSMQGRKRVSVKREASVIELFGCGLPGKGVEVRVVDPNTRQRVPDGEIGEIWVNSANKALGYWGRERESIEKFKAKLKGSDLDWLRTGDLGFIHEGEIVVAGRLDDMMIIRGKNVFPQDVESIVSSSDSRIRPGRVIAFPASAAEEKMGIVLEMKESLKDKNDYSKIAQNARMLLQQELGLTQFIFIFAPNGSVPKTTSGKLQRRKCQQLWRNGTLKPILELNGSLGG